MLEKWRLTVDQWEALPWWQQDAYLEAAGRRAEREKAEKKDAPSPKAKGRVAGRKNSGQTSTASARVSLKNSALWANRGRPPAGPVVMGPSPARRDRA